MLKVPPAWKSGYYAAQVRLAGKDGNYQPGGARRLANSGTPELFFVVRPAHPGRDSRILIQLSTKCFVSVLFLRVMIFLRPGGSAP